MACDKRRLCRRNQNPEVRHATNGITAAAQEPFEEVEDAAITEPKGTANEDARRRTLQIKIAIAKRSDAGGSESAKGCIRQRAQPLARARQEGCTKYWRLGYEEPKWASECEQGSWKRIEERANAACEGEECDYQRRLGCENPKCANGVTEDDYLRRLGCETPKCANGVTECQGCQEGA